MPESREERKERDRRYYAAHRQQINARTRAYSQAHKEQLKEGKRKWHAAHREQELRNYRLYAQAHRDRLRAQKRAYYMAHRAQLNARASIRYLHRREQYAENNRRYRIANMERIKAGKRDYYLANREHILERARLAGRPPGGRGRASRTAYMMDHPEEYVWQGLGIELRPYQSEPLARIVESIEQHLGDTIVLMFPRQSGKDELLLDLLIYLADLYSTERAGIVVVNPTFKPQTVTALERFDASLDCNNLTHGVWRRHGGFMRIIDKARISFLSGDAHANVAGATASLLLVVNEAQDIAPQVYYQKFVPMAASVNATRLLAGTAWTSQTLLAREMRLALQAEQADGRKRVFTVDADGVRRAVPWYGRHVDAIVQAHGREHPLVKTQYFNEEIDAEIGMFPPARRAMMKGDRSASAAAERGACAFLIDVAGQDESNPQMMQTSQASQMGDRGRDATTLSIVEVDLTTLETLQAPTYRVVGRFQWTGLNHLAIFGKLKALAGQWRPQHIVIDATGVGEGLWAMLDKAFPTRVLPVKFSSEKKSEIGYRFLSIIETGRFRDCCESTGSVVDRSMVDRQYAACRAEVLPGPRKTMRWGVPDGARDENGALIHDDVVLADALVAELDSLHWTIHFPSYYITPVDPLEEMSHFSRRGY